MADVRDLFYHGVRQQIRRVLEAMGEERIERGLTAFTDGQSNWSACFFARAYPELDLYIGNPEAMIAQALGMGENKIPMRIVYTLFDGIGKNRTMSKTELRDFISDFVNDVRDPEKLAAINSLIDSVNLLGVSTDTHKPIFDQSCHAK